MIDRIRQRLTYANVVATLALFAAVGGGAVAAVGGSGGTVRVGAVKPGTFPGTKVLGLAGVGVLRAECFKGNTGGQWTNRSGKPQTVTVDVGSSAPTVGCLPHPSRPTKSC